MHKDRTIKNLKTLSDLEEVKFNAELETELLAESNTEG